MHVLSLSHHLQLTKNYYWYDGGWEYCKFGETCCEVEYNGGVGNLWGCKWVTLALLVVVLVLAVGVILAIDGMTLEDDDE